MEKKYLISSLYIILIVSVIYGFLVGSGFYGFSNDFYGEYYKKNLIYPSYREGLGSLLSTITIFDTHLGVYLTSFFLAISSGLLIRSIFIANNKNSNYFFFVDFSINTSHTSNYNVNIWCYETRLGNVICLYWSFNYYIG